MYPGVSLGARQPQMEPDCGARAGATDSGGGFAERGGDERRRERAIRFGDGQGSACGRTASYIAYKSTSTSARCRMLAKILSELKTRGARNARSSIRGQHDCRHSQTARFV